MLTQTSQQVTRAISIITAESRHQQVSFIVVCSHCAVDFSRAAGYAGTGTSVSKGNIPSNLKQIFLKMGNIISFETLAPTCMITLS